jgi:hypothetical protein
MPDPLNERGTADLRARQEKYANQGHFSGDGSVEADYLRPV